MKQILIIALLLCSIGVHAQATFPKPEAPKKPEFQIQNNLPVKFGVNITVTQASNFLTVLNVGGLQALDYSDKITAVQATQLKKEYAAVLDSVSSNMVREFNRLYKSEQAKFTADTTKKVTPKLKK